MPAITEPTILRRLHAMCDETSLRQTAERLQVSAAYLSDILLGKRKPGPKILKALRIKRTVERRVLYEPTNGR